MTKTGRVTLIPKSSRVERRLQLMLVFCVSIFAVLSFRLWTIQIYQHEMYKEKAKYNYVRQVPIQSERGMILDRNGRVLARDVNFCDIWIPIQTERGRRAVTDEIRQSLTLLSEILEEPFDKLEARYMNSQRDLYYKHRRVRVARRIPFEKYVAVTERLIEFPEEAMVFPEKVTTRFYPKQDLAAHVLGHMGEVSREQLALEAYADYEPGDWIGKGGVERQYERDLRGVDGVEEVTVDRFEIQRGEPRVKKPAVPGKNLVLSLDYDVQLAAERALGASRGVIVAADPRDNSILALASSPRYNPNHYRRDFGTNYFDPEKPLYHRAVAGAYEPGSVIKIFEAVALMEELGMSPLHGESCPGLYFYPGFGKPWRCHKKGGHGSINMYDAVCLSCNVYFYKTVNKLGINRLFLWMSKFGFNDKTGVDLPGEKFAPYPNPNTKSPWYGGYTINLAIGQGELRLTPVQVNTAVCAIANRGKLFQPRVAMKVLAPGERSVNGKAVKRFEPVMVADPIDAATKTWDAIHKAMWEVVNNPRGTGRRVKNEDFVLAGKTGTAQNPRGDNHAWFVCYGPYENPEIAVTIILENAGHGGEAASPLIVPILDAYLRDRAEVIARSDAKSESM